MFSVMSWPLPVKWLSHSFAELRGPFALARMGMECSYAPHRSYRSSPFLLISGELFSVTLNAPLWSSEHRKHALG